MTILVIGRQGQLAVALNACAHGRGVDLFAVGRPDFDILKPDDVTKTIDAFKPDVVINCAAYTAVDRAEQEPDAARVVNAHGAGALAEATAKAGIPLIHMSTDYVFDGSKASPYDETDPVAPLGVYGKTKREGEERVAEANPKHLIVRTAWVFSPFGRNFAKTMLALAAEQSDLCVVDDQLGSPTYAPHLANALLSIADRIAKAAREDALWGMYHVAGRGETTWYGLAREIFAQAELVGGPSANVRGIATSQYPTPARRPANSRLACDKAAGRFAVELPDWRIGVRACVASLFEIDPQARSKL